MKWYLDVIKNYVRFQGRARRKEYWMFNLINTIIFILLLIFNSYSELGSILYIIYSLFLFLPSLAVSVRRLHDTGRSGWWNLLLFVPIIGSIVLLVFFCLDSEVQDNKYGVNPKRSF